jgi:1,4-alpha-glucan branching enzyme
MKSSPKPSGYVTFVLHSHLPYVVHHGTWPHGLDWLHEAAAETYLPMLRMFAELQQGGTPLKANVNLSPILLEQLNHPTFKEEFPIYVQRKVEAAKKDEQDFVAQGEDHFARVAVFWQEFFQRALDDFEGLNRDIITGFKRFYDSGDIEIITCGATHGYFPLLGTDASIRAQVRLGVATHERFFGRTPKGIWLPECGYRPGGLWSPPVSMNGASRPKAPYLRDGVEQILAENGIQFFFVDTHLVETNVRFSPYELIAGDVPVALEEEVDGKHPSLYRPYYAGPRRRGSQAAFFTRDPKTGVQVWSGDHGYPGDAVYLDFHKKRWPGGHRYWQVTHPRVDLGGKTAYYPHEAENRTLAHAEHFVDITCGVLGSEPKNGGAPPILCAPFDAELFGHWWFEGVTWLKNIAKKYADPGCPIKLVTCAEYLQQSQPHGYLVLDEGSWGKNGTNEVWFNPENAWTWKHIYPAEQAVVQMAESGRWKDSPQAERLATQLCRELLLLESSDWQFLITTEHARDYAEKRFNTHLEQFRALLDCWRRYESTGELSAEALHRLEEIEQRDSVFPELTPQTYLR